MKLRKSSILSATPSLALMKVFTRTTLIPSTSLVWYHLLAYPSCSLPFGKLGAQVTTVTSCPHAAQNFARSCTRFAAAFVSGG